MWQSITGMSDQHGAPIGWRCGDSQTLDAADFVLVPAVVLLVGFGLVGPPSAILVLGEPARPDWNLLLVGWQFQAAIKSGARSTTGAGRCSAIHRS